MGGYRTPAQLWSIGLLWPASDTLHHGGRSVVLAGFVGADIPSVSRVGGVGWFTVGSPWSELTQLPDMQLTIGLTGGFRVRAFRIAKRKFALSDRFRAGCPQTLMRGTSFRRLERQPPE